MTLEEIEKLKNDLIIAAAETTQNIEERYYKPKWFAEKKETLRVAMQIFDSSFRMLEQLKKSMLEMDQKNNSTEMF